MRSVQISGATGAPPIILQTDRIRRRIATSASVAALIAELAYGRTCREDLGTLASITAERVETSFMRAGGQG